ncbi:MAG: hypothetical protein ACM3MK_09000 [Chitinophagales bacterium]
MIYRNVTKGGGDYLLIKPENGRALIQELDGKIRVVIPTKKNWFIILFVGFWLCGWAFGELSVLGEIFKSDKPGGVDIFLIAWLGGWTVGGAWAIYAFLWNLAGHEEIIIASSNISIAKKILGLGLNKEYSLSDAKRFRVSTERNNTWFNSGGMSYWGFKDGKIRFDYGMKTIRFAGQVDEAEANHILNLFRQRGYIQEIKSPA